MSELPTARRASLPLPPATISDKATAEYLTNLVHKLESTIAGSFDNDDIVRNAADVAQTTADSAGDILYADTRFYVGSFTRDTTTASGAQTVSGVGFTPKVVIFFVVEEAGGTPGASWGFDDGSTPLVLLDFVPTADSYTQTGSSIRWYEDADKYYTGSISSFGSDGFNVAWVRTDTPTTTIKILFIAFR